MSSRVNEVNGENLQDPPPIKNPGYANVFTTFKFFFTYRLSDKPFLIRLLTIPPHLKYAATLPCNLSLMACFADINVSQGSVATYARCGGIFNIRLTAYLPRNLPVKKKS